MSLCACILCLSVVYVCWSVSVVYVCRSACLLTMFVCVSICIHVCLSVYVCTSVCLSVLSIFVCRPVSVSVFVYLCLCVCLLGFMKTLTLFPFINSDVIALCTVVTLFELIDLSRIGVAQYYIE